MRCSQAVLDFLSTTDVGRLVPAEEDAGSEASEWELRGLREREEERRPRSCAEGEEQPPFLPTPSFMASAEEDRGRVSISFVLSFGALRIFLRQPPAPRCSTRPAGSSSPASQWCGYEYLLSAGFVSAGGTAGD